MSPCVLSDDYSFSTCVENKIISEVGCKPYWIKDSGSGNMPTCTKLSQYHTFWIKYNELNMMHGMELIEKTGCFKPCHYMEYKVQMIVKL